MSLVLWSRDTFENIFVFFYFFPLKIFLIIHSLTQCFIVPPPVERVCVCVCVCVCGIQGYLKHLNLVHLTQ